MRRRDIRECVEFYAQHPILGPRYGRTLDQLGAAWSQLMNRHAVTVIVFEEIHGGKARKIGVGARAFVSDEFVKEMKTAPQFWAGPELVKRVLAGNSPILSDKELREANAEGGLNLFAWDGAVSASEFGRREVIQSLFVEFVERHRGFRLKELITQGTSVDIMEAQIQSGGFLVGEDGEYGEVPAKPLSEVLKAPHCLGVSRELAMQKFGTWVSSMFVYQEPRFGFRPSEQRLLALAFSGATDEQLSDQLGVSLSAVKKTWHLIYERVAETDPKLVPDARVDEEGATERGKTKKQRLLAHLREHMEELRPFGDEF